MQEPVTMDQVLLRWEGGGSMLLARVRDTAGCWLCNQEVHSKAGSSTSMQAWHKYRCGEHTHIEALSCLVLEVPFL